ncbi:uncharacterized protein LOC121868668 [Homarus americanus]|uniref:uncharacterized protein LOC121868668 n=1 Tax=Homarus americanus TaxID=6706 RepID=UPI001C484803|nr:uncharacterized protein LOC121868668 [Homarus americanus]
MANDWWVKKAQEIQAFADVHNTHGFYEAVKSIYGPQRRNVTPVRSLDGPTLYKINQMIAVSWAEHFSTLLNQINPIRPTALDNIPPIPTLHLLEEAPLLREVETAIRGLSNKSAGPDGIPAEIYKHGGPHLTERLHSLLLTIWATETIPPELERCKYHNTV